jgi:hypothetical protein
MRFHCSKVTSLAAEVPDAAGIMGDAGDHAAVGVGRHAQVERIVGPHPGDGPVIRAKGLRQDRRRGQERKNAEQASRVSTHDFPRPVFSALAVLDANRRPIGAKAQA